MQWLAPCNRGDGTASLGMFMIANYRHKSPWDTGGNFLSECCHNSVSVQWYRCLRRRCVSCQIQVYENIIVNKTTSTRGREYVLQPLYWKRFVQSIQRNNVTFKVTVKDFSTVIINATPSPWSRPGSSHEDLSMHANTHVHTHVFCWLSGLNSGQDGGCYLAFDSVTYQAKLSG
jgi:hypothetical protein